MNNKNRSFGAQRTALGRLLPLSPMWRCWIMSAFTQI